MGTARNLLQGQPGGLLRPPAGSGHSSLLEAHTNGRSMNAECLLIPFTISINEDANANLATFRSFYNLPNALADWTDYRISLCVFKSVSQSVSQSVCQSVSLSYKAS